MTYEEIINDLEHRITMLKQLMPFSATHVEHIAKEHSLIELQQKLHKYKTSIITYDGEVIHTPDGIKKKKYIRIISPKD